MTKPHVVAIPVEAQGHTFPMMHLCCYLARNGFTITFIVMLDTGSGPDWLVRNSSWPPQDLDITLVKLRGELPCKPRQFISATAMDLVAGTEHLFNSYRNTLREFLSDTSDRHHVSAAICDYQKTWSLTIAMDLGIPAAVLFTGSASWSWFELQMPQLVVQSVFPMQTPGLLQLDCEDDYVISEELGLHRSHIPWHYWNDKPWQEYTAMRNSVAFSKANWVLVSSCEEIDSRMVAAMKELLGSKYMTVGPLYQLNKPPGEDECLKWLDKQAPGSVLYISFGSIASLSPECIEEFVMGLEASGCTYLWVRRMEDDDDPVGYENMLRSKEQGRLVVPWAPQTQVLAHSSVGAFLSHCGWNSTVEGAVNGLPTLCWPCLFEQNLNTRMIVEVWKTGAVFKRSITRNIVEKEEVERVIRMVMEGEEGKLMKQRAAELAGRIKAAVMPGGSSLTNLHLFMEGIS